MRDPVVPPVNVDRWARVLADHPDVDVVVATTKENVRYLSGFSPASFVLMPATEVYAVAHRDAPGRPAVVCPAGDLDAELQRPLAGVGYRPYGEFYIEMPTRESVESGDGLRLAELTGTVAPSALAALVAAIEEQATGGRIAVDERGVAEATLRGLRERFGDRVVLGAALLAQVRVVKTAPEIERLTRALRATEAGVAAALAAARVGISEQQLADELERATVAHGGTPVFSCVLFGANGAYPNGAPSPERRLEVGDVLRFDVGCEVDGYHSDIARTAVLGPPDARIAGYYAAILAGEQAAIDLIAPGVTGREVLDAAVAGTRAAGIPHYRRNHVGHGIGLNVYDEPVLGAHNEQALVAGTVLEVETPYYEAGVVGLQIEDTVLVTEQGCELLTASSRALTVLPVR
jgi:Xaa-Pro dipeptidase